MMGLFFASKNDHRTDAVTNRGGGLNFNSLPPGARLERRKRKPNRKDDR